MRRLVLLTFLTALFAMVLGAAAINGPQTDRPQYAPNLIKVKLTTEAVSRATLPQGLYAETPNFGMNELDQLMSVNGGQTVIRAHIRMKDTAWEERTGFDRWFLIKLDGKVNVAEAISSFKANRYIEEAIPEYYAYTTAVPNDTYYANNWGHNNTGQGPGGGGVGFDTDSQLAWDNTQGYGSASTIIAIIDTGTDTHPDLRLVAGYDYGDNDSDPSDNSADPNHGTACSGVAAGRANNALGVTGSGGGCSVMPLKIADSAGSLGFTAIENALVHTGDNNVDVASMSFGAEGGMAEGSSPSTDTALEYAYSHGVTLLAATANSNTSAIAYPSNHNKVISVGAASPTGQRKSTTSSDGETWWGSNYGGTTQDAALSVDIMAPTILPATDRVGTNGYSTTDYYMSFNGTSCATPYAAGVAGLLISKDPSLTPAQVRTALTTTATDMTIDGGAGWDRYTGYGMVNSAAALNSLIPGMPACQITSPAGGTTFDLNSTISVAATASDTDGTITQVAFYIDAAATPSYTDYSSPYTWNWNSTGVSGGSHTIKAIATDNSSNTATSTVTITLLAPPDEGFETGGFGTFAWNNSSASPWSVQTADKFSGTYAAKSGVIDHSGSTTLSLPMTVSSAGNISFYQKISSESGYDYLRFYIDGVEQGSWSGAGSWSAQSYAVAAGTRTFTWTYSKDGSVASGSDCAFLDHIIFPPHGTYYAAPQNFSATPGNAVVNLAWQAPASGTPTGYKIFKNSTLLTTVTGLSYTDNAVINGTTYSYYLKAVYGANESDPTATINATPTDVVTTSIIIGTGTTSNGTTTACPINVYYESLHGQAVYTKAEINALGVYGPINITEIGFNVTGLPTLAMPSFVVRMGHTSSTDVASWIPLSALSTVYTAASYQPTATGWNMLTLSTPFTWNGNDNIALDTAFGDIGAWTQSGTTMFTSVTNGYRYVRSDDADQTNVFTGGSTLINRPNLKLKLAQNSVGPQIVVNPLTLSYGSVNAGSSSVLQFTIQNTGDQLLTGNITTPTGYTVALASGRNNDSSALTLEVSNSDRNVLSYSVNGGATNIYNLTFSPTAVQAYNGNVSISSNDPANPSKTISLTGTGAGALITVNPTSRAFGNVAVNASSTLQFTIQNTGNVTLTGSIVTPTGYTVAAVRGAGFGQQNMDSERNTLSISVPAGQTLTYNLTFAPTAVQVYNGNVTITTNAFNAATTNIAVSGTGTGSIVTVNPTTHAFGSLTVNSSSTLQFTIQNTGNTALIGTVTTPSGFSVAAVRDGGRNTLSISVPAGQTLTYNLTFSPISVQAYSGNVVIATNAVNTPTVNISVSGSGYIPPTISLNYNTLDATLAINASGTDTFTISNSGSQNLTYTLTESPVVGWFSAAPGSGSVAGGGNQLITGTFSATGLTPGTYTTTLQVASNDAINPLLNVAVTLNVTNSLPTIDLPANLTYDINGSLVVDFAPYISDSDPQTLILGYSGNSNVIVSTVGLMVTFTATSGWYGTENLTFSVNDGYAYAYDSVPVTVSFVNTAPTIELPLSCEFDMNGSLVMDFAPYVNDVDAQSLTLGYSGNANVNVSISDMIVTFNAVTDWIGEETLTFSVYDGTAYAYDTMTVKVNLVYLPPPPVETIIESTNGMTVGWLPVPHATEYKIYRSYDPYGTYEYIGTTTDPTFEDWGVDARAFYKVVAVYTPTTK